MAEAVAAQQSGQCLPLGWIKSRRCGCGIDIQRRTTLSKEENSSVELALAGGGQENNKKTRQPPRPKFCGKPATKRLPVRVYTSLAAAVC